MREARTLKHIGREEGVMKVLLINGSPNEKRCTHTALAEVAGALEAQGVETEIAWIGRDPIRGCLGCGGCGKRGDHRASSTTTW